jgi:hypothetical protein
MARAVRRKNAARASAAGLGTAHFHAETSGIFVQIRDCTVLREIYFSGFYS